MNISQIGTVIFNILFLVFAVLLIFRKRLKCKIKGHERYDSFGKIYLQSIFDIAKKEPDPYIAFRCVRCNRLIETDDYEVMVLSKYA